MVRNSKPSHKDQEQGKDVSCHQSFFNNILEVLAKAIKQTKRKIKGIQTRKEEKRKAMTKD